MTTLKLTSGDDMPILGLGTWQGQSDSIKNAVKEALKIGYRHVDCAWAYLNENILGEAFRESFQSGVLTRKDLFYTSKLPQQGHRPEKVRHYLEISLKNLGFDYLDLYLIHFPVSTKYVDDALGWPTDDNGNVLLDEDVDVMETWKALEDCVDAGLVKNIGLSNFNLQQVQHVYDNARIKPANLQVECHVYLQQRPLHELCQKLGMTMTAYSPLGSTGAPAFFKKRFGTDFQLAKNVLEEPLLKRLSEKYQKSPAQVAIKFLVQRGIVVIPKSVTPSRLEENIKVFDFTLEESEMKQLEALDQGIRLFKFDFVKGIQESKKYPFERDS